MWRALFVEVAQERFTDNVGLGDTLLKGEPTQLLIKRLRQSYTEGVVLCGCHDSLSSRTPPFYRGYMAN